MLEYNKLFNFNIEDNYFFINYKYIVRFSRHMGLFGLFKKKVEQRIVKFEDLNDWLDKHVERQELGTTLGIIKREINAKLKKLKELLNVLEEVQVKDKSVFPERALNMMDGNRKSYIQKIRKFESNIKFPEKYDEFKPFLEFMSERLEELASETQKNYFILKEFMEDHVRAVSNKLGELDKIIAQGREQLENTSLDIVKEIKEIISKYYDTEQEIYTLKKRIVDLRKAGDDLNDKRKKIDEKIFKLKNGRGFTEYLKLRDKEQMLKIVVKEAEKKILRIFYDVEPAMKKYHNKTKEGLLKEYLDDSLIAFMNDKDLKILSHLKNMLKELMSLELKESKLKKVKDVLKNIDEKEFKKIKKSINELKEEFDDLSKRVKNHSAKLNIKEQEGWLESLDKDIEEESDKMQDVENKLERLNLTLIKQKIKEKIQLLDPNTELDK